MAAGDILNTGSRLAQAAPIGGILVDKSTYRATRHLIEFGAAEPVRAGKAVPLPAWQAIAPRARLDQDDLQRPHIPLVGRREELSLLLDAFERARSGPTSQLVSVGEPGIGKSRLVLAAELAARPRPCTGARADPCRTGRKPRIGHWRDPEGPRRHSPDRRPCRHRGEAPAGNSAGRTRTRRGRMGDQPHAPTRRAARGRSRWRRPPQRRPCRLAPLLRGVAASLPLVVVFEDIHWADEGSWSSSTIWPPSPQASRS